MVMVVVMVTGWWREGEGRGEVALLSGKVVAGGG